MKTRSKIPASRKSAPMPEDGIDETSSKTVQKLEPNVPNPPNVFVLPKDLASNARVISMKISLGSGGQSASRRYLVCPRSGFYEFTRVAAPKGATRSWLLSPGTQLCKGTDGSDRTSIQDLGANRLAGEGEAYTLQSPDIFVATPLDPLYVLLGSPEAVWPNTVMGNAEFLSIDTRLSVLRSQHEHLDQVMRDDHDCVLEKQLAERIKAVSALQEIPGEEMESTYCLSIPKLYAELVKAARRTVQKGMPASMEERFVTQPLRVPEPLVPREDSGVGSMDQSTGEAKANDGVSLSTSQDTATLECTAITTSTTQMPSISQSNATNGDHRHASEEIRTLLRIRTVIEYISNSYLPLDLRKSIQGAMVRDSRQMTTTQSSQPIDFQPLNEHLARIDVMKKEAQALRSLSDNISRKRSAFDDGEALEKAEAKKRKKEEEDARKKNISRGVQQLAKADTSGMKKLSAFFTKAPSKKA